MVGRWGDGGGGVVGRWGDGGGVALSPRNHSGPFHHKAEIAGSVRDVPLEGRSAGLLVPGQCLQCSAGTS